MKTAYIGLGSNLDDPIQQIKIAVDQLERLPSIKVNNISSLYATQPLGPQDQPDFVNAVIEIQTTLSANALLSFLQQIETVQKRVRTTERWGPRTIDCDILLFESDIIDTKLLKIPHPGLSQREFVVYPLSEIAPDLILPTGEKIEEIKTRCPQRGLHILSEKIK